VPVEERIDGDLKKRPNVWDVQQAGNIYKYCARVERQQVGVFHEGQGTPSEVVAQLLRHVLGMGIAGLHFSEETLKHGRSAFLRTTVVGIVECQRDRCMTS